MNFYIAEPVTRLPLFNFLVRYIFTEVLNINKTAGNQRLTRVCGKVDAYKMFDNWPGDGSSVCYICLIYRLVQKLTTNEDNN